MRNAQTFVRIIMNTLLPIEFWFVTGSQHLYGEAVLKRVAANSKKIVAELNGSKRLSNWRSSTATPTCPLSSNNSATTNFTTTSHLG